MFYGTFMFFVFFNLLFVMIHLIVMLLFLSLFFKISLLNSIQFKNFI